MQHAPPAPLNTEHVQPTGTAVSSQPATFHYDTPAPAPAPAPSIAKSPEEEDDESIGNSVASVSDFDKKTGPVIKAGDVIQYNRYIDDNNVWTKGTVVAVDPANEEFPVTLSTGDALCTTFGKVRTSKGGWSLLSNCVLVPGECQGKTAADDIRNNAGRLSDIMESSNEEMERRHGIKDTILISQFTGGNRSGKSTKRASTQGGQNKAKRAKQSAEQSTAGKKKGNGEEKATSKRPRRKTARDGLDRTRRAMRSAGMDHDEK